MTTTIKPQEKEREEEQHQCPILSVKQMKISREWGKDSAWVCESIDKWNQSENSKIYGVIFCPFCGVKL